MRGRPPAPRKTPRQERSRALVGSLLEATARVLVRHGAAGLTTNRVAAEAGVSVGSLYQYFPDKHALLAGLVEALGERMAATLAALGRSLADVPTDVAIRRIVEGALAATRENAELHRALAAARPQGLDAYERMNRRLTDVLAEWIAGRQLDVEDPTLVAYTIVTALDGLTDHALVHRPELLESPRYARVLERLVAGALGRGERPLSARSGAAGRGTPRRRASRTPV